MPKFTQHPDGWVIIIRDEKEFKCSLIQWKKFEPSYPDLPEEFTGREYRQGVEHRVFNSINEKRLGRDWLEGDFYIGKVEEYIKSLSKIENPEV